MDSRANTGSNSTTADAADHSSVDDRPARDWRSRIWKAWPWVAFGLPALLALVVVASLFHMAAEPDAAGMTRGEVERLGVEGQYNLVGERYERMQEIMTEAQLVVSDEAWKWFTPGYAPWRGTTAYAPLPGADTDNSYHMSILRTIHPEGAKGSVSDARPVYDYFAAKGWETELTEDDFSELELEATRDFTVSAITEDGYRVKYTVQQNGQYNMEVFTDTFWGDPNVIVEEQLARLPKGSLFPRDLTPEQSPKHGWTVPGVYAEYPAWDDPILNDEDE